MSAFDRFADWVAAKWSSAPWFALCVLGIGAWIVSAAVFGWNNQIVHLWLNSPTTGLTFLGVFLLDRLDITDPVDDEGQKEDA